MTDLDTVSTRARAPAGPPPGPAPSRPPAGRAGPGGRPPPLRLGRRPDTTARARRGARAGRSWAILAAAATTLAVVVGGAVVLVVAAGSSPPPAAPATPPAGPATLLGRPGGPLAPRWSYARPAPAGPAELAAPGRLLAAGRDAPDPFVLLVGGRYYLYTSHGDLAHVNVPVQDGSVLGRWGPVRDAMPAPPPWAVPGFTWAPDVQRFGDHYVLYFTSVDARTRPLVECIGTAEGATPLGPFAPSAAPLVCQLGQHGSIDPRTFSDTDGSTYLLWKSDDNADVNGTEPTGIYSQRLSPDGAHLVGRPTRIFGPDRAWEGRIVEAPDLVSVGGTDWLFYSGGWFNQPGYAIGAARCAGPLGPCRDRAAAPLLGSNLEGAGPGEPSVFADLSGLWLVYTPWRSNTPRPTLPRPVMVARLGFSPRGPYLARPVGGPLRGA